MRLDKIIPSLEKIHGMSMPPQDLAAIHALAHVMIAAPCSPELPKIVPENLYTKPAEVSLAKKLMKRNPTLPEIKSWVEQAKQMPRMMNTNVVTIAKQVLYYKLF